MSSSRPTSLVRDAQSPNAIPHQRTKEHANLIQRNNEIKRLLSWASNPVDVNQNPLCILFGLPGMGKSTLARQLTSHPKIQDTFGSHIFWLDTGENPTDLVDQINEIGFESADDWAYKSDVQEAIHYLFDLFKEEALLLVLEDVGTVELALQFLPPPDNPCHVLVLSRNPRLAPALKSTEIRLQEFSAAEARKAGAILNTEEAKGSTGRTPLVVYLNHLCQMRGLKPPIITRDMSIDAALAHLWNQLLSRYSSIYKTAIYALGIFPSLTPLSYPVISRLWQKLIPGISLDNLDELYEDLKVLRILSHRMHSNTAVTYDLFQQYVENYADVDLIKLHSVLLDLYPPGPVLEGDSPSYDEYIYRFLPYHLSRANKTDTLFKLLLSVEWISSKVNKTDSLALQQDYRYGRSDKTIRLVDEAIRLSAPSLTVDSSQIISQLIGRLQQIDVIAIKGLVKALRNYRSSESLWLDPWHVDLKTPSSSLLMSLKDHQDELLSVDLNVESQRAISSSRDISIHIWDLKQKKVLKKLTSLTEPAQQVTLLSNGTQALSASGSDITTWDLHKGKATQTYRFHKANILAMYAFADNQSILSADEAGQVLYTNLWARIIKHRLPTDRELTWTLAATRDQSTAFAAGNDEFIQAWDLHSGKLKRTFTAHDDWVWALCTTKNDRFLLSASEDQTIIIWDLDASRVFRVLKGHKAGVRFVCLAADDTLVLSADEEQSIILWDFQTGQILRSFTGLSNWMNDFKPLPDGKGAFLATEEPELKLWSMGGKQRSEEHNSHDKGIRALRLTPGDIQLISASDDATIRKWHANTAKLLNSFTGHTDWISSLSLSRKGSTLVSGSFDKTLRIWDVDSGRCKRILKGHTDWVWCAAISPNNRFLASGSEDRSIRVWDMPSGKPRHILNTHEGPVTNIIISEDNRHIISASTDHTMCIWKAKDGSLQHMLRGHKDTIRSIALSPLGDRIVSGSDDGTIRIWNFILGMEDECLKNPGGAVRTVYVLKNGFRLLSVSEDHVLRVWDLVESKPLFTLKGHNSDISHLAVSGDGRWAATTGSDCRLCLWDLENGHMIDSFFSDYPMTYCIFNTNSERVIGADAGGGLHFLHVRGLEY